MFQLFKQFPQWLRLAVIFPLLFFNGFLLSLLFNYLRPLIDYVLVAALLAFLLELLVKFLQQKGMKRGWAIATVLLLTLLTVTILVLILLPIMATQLTQLVEQAPQWILNTGAEIKRLEKLPIFAKYSLDTTKLFEQGLNRLSASLEGLGSQAINILLGTFTSFVSSLLVLIITIFLLIGGESFVNGILNWLPKPWNSKVRTYFYQVFKNYFFARILLATIASISRLIFFIVFGVPYSILLAFGLGITSLIPFISGIIILIATLVLSINNFTVGIKFLAIAIIIDLLTDNVLAPRLMGELIGLNPVWIFIALFIGAKIGGVLGLLLAIPIASVTKQIIDDLREEKRKEIEPEIPMDN